jgi:hypothetical protein
MEMLGPYLTSRPRCGNRTGSEHSLDTALTSAGYGNLRFPFEIVKNDESRKAISGCAGGSIDTAE